MRTPVIIDCDPGIDDAVALCLAFGSPELDVVGVTAVAGNIPLDRTSENLGKILDLLAVPADLPFHDGHAGPMGRVEREPDEPIHGPDGLGGVELPPGRPAHPGHAVDWMADAVLRHGEGLTIVALGPLTNVASMLHTHPDTRGQLREVVVMGGAAHVPGNVTITAEFNIHADPEAARYVFESGVPVRLVPLDVTRSALFTQPDIDRLRPAGGTAAVAAQMLSFLVRGYARSHGVQACAVHDAVAVAAVTHPEMMAWRPAALTVECGGEFTRGTVLVDTRGRLGRGTPAQIATSIDAPAFAELLATRIRRPGRSSRPMVHFSRRHDRRERMLSRRAWAELP